MASHPVNASWNTCSVGKDSITQLRTSLTSGQRLGPRCKDSMVTPQFGSMQTQQGSARLLHHSGFANYVCLEFCRGSVSSLASRTCRTKSEAKNTTKQVGTKGETASHEGQKIKRCGYRTRRPSNTNESRNSPKLQSLLTLQQHRRNASSMHSACRQDC